MIKIYVENPTGSQVILADTKIEKELNNSIKILGAAINITGELVTEHEDGTTTINAALLKYAKKRNKIVIELSLADEDINMLAKTAQDYIKKTKSVHAVSLFDEIINQVANVNKNVT